MATPQEVFGGGVAVITGAGGGIGEGLALHAALRLGMAVALADIDEAALARVQGQITAAGGRAIAVSTDVRAPEALERLAARAYSELGDVRLLVNNAGIEQFGWLWETPLANWKRLVEININGVFYGIRAFVPRMIAANNRAHIWNLASMAAVAAAPLQAPYMMSKHAVLAITECLRLEMELAGHDIQVNAVLPGVVTSRLFQSAGSVENGDDAVAEQERQAMLAIAAQGMSPAAAAEAVFRQAAGGEFYLLTQPKMVGGAMQARAEQLANRRPPRLVRRKFSFPEE